MGIGGVRGVGMPGGRKSMQGGGRLSSPVFIGGWSNVVDGIQLMYGLR